MPQFVALIYVRPLALMDLERASKRRPLTGVHQHETNKSAKAQSAKNTASEPKLSDRSQVWCEGERFLPARARGASSQHRR